MHMTGTLALPRKSSQGAEVCLLRLPLAAVKQRQQQQPSHPAAGRLAYCRANAALTFGQAAIMWIRSGLAMPLPSQKAATASASERAQQGR